MRRASACTWFRARWSVGCDGGLRRQLPDGRDLAARGLGRALAVPATSRPVGLSPRGVPGRSARVARRRCAGRGLRRPVSPQDRGARCGDGRGCRLAGVLVCGGRRGLGARSRLVVVRSRQRGSGARRVRLGGGLQHLGIRQRLSLRDVGAVAVRHRPPDPADRGRLRDVPAVVARGQSRVRR